MICYILLGLGLGRFLDILSLLFPALPGTLSVPAFLSHPGFDEHMEKIPAMERLSSDILQGKESSWFPENSKYYSF